MSQNKSKGGTEIMRENLISKLTKRNPKVLDRTQIAVLNDKLKSNKKKILWLHDLSNDPRLQILKEKKNLDVFKKIVFVSNWQQFIFNAFLKVPYQKGVVIQNAIEPIPKHDKPNEGKLNICYFSTPHRGLEILLNVWEKIQKIPQIKDKVELNVYSSFKIYNRPELDKDFVHLYDKANTLSNVNYYGTVSNDEIRNMLKKQHIFAYPSIYQETSCLCLLEAMSAGCLCVISNFGALPETSSNFAWMHNYYEDTKKHEQEHFENLIKAIEEFWNEDVQTHLKEQVKFTNKFYNWNTRIKEWEKLIKSL